MDGGRRPREACACCDPGCGSTGEKDRAWQDRAWQGKGQDWTGLDGYGVVCAPQPFETATETEAL